MPEFHHPSTIPHIPWQILKASSSPDLPLILRHFSTLTPIGHFQLLFFLSQKRISNFSSSGSWEGIVQFVLKIYERSCLFSANLSSLKETTQWVGSLQISGLLLELNWSHWLCSQSGSGSALDLWPLASVSSLKLKSTAGFGQWGLQHLEAHFSSAPCPDFSSHIMQGFFFSLYNVQSAAWILLEPHFW